MTSLVTIDAVVRLDETEGIALLNVPSTLDVFDHHFPRFPVLPGVLLLGAFTDLATLVLRHRAADSGTVWRLGGVRTVRYRHYVRPGDQVELQVRLGVAGATDAVFTATASVDGRRVTTARELLMVTP